MQKTVTVPFMLLGILFNICLVDVQSLETKVVQVGGITVPQVDRIPDLVYHQ